jgi:hypothetical protein
MSIDQTHLLSSLGLLASFRVCLCGPLSLSSSSFLVLFQLVDILLGSSLLLLSLFQGRLLLGQPGRGVPGGLVSLLESSRRFAVAAAQESINVGWTKRVDVSNVQP